MNLHNSNNAVRWIRAPLWALQLVTGAKSFEGNPLIGSESLNRWGLHRRRVSLAHRLAAARRRRLAPKIPLCDREAFERDGFIVRRDFLAKEHFEALAKAIRAYRGPIREKFEGRTLLRKVTVSPALAAAMPELKSLSLSADWQSLIRFVGARDSWPAMYLQGVVQQAAAAEDRDPQTFLHADTFHPTVKAWLYLTDVEADAGPLVYVPGSHRLTPERLAWEVAMSRSAVQSDDFETRQGSFRIGEEALTSLKLPPPCAMAVPANTLIVADTFGFHARGRSAGRSVRVEVWGVGHRNPFLPIPALDPLFAGIGSVGRSGNAWVVRRGISIFDDVTGEGLDGPPGQSTLSTD